MARVLLGGFAPNVGDKERASLALIMLSMEGALRFLVAPDEGALLL